MMDLVLKQMHQQAVAPFGLYPRVTVDANLFAETVGGQILAYLDETPVDG
jgi:hypothetical protein